MIDNSKIKLEELNDTYYRLADLIGIDDTIKLSKEFSGQVITFKKRYDLNRDYAELVECVGAKKAEKIIKAFSGEKVYISSLKRAMQSQLYREIGKAYTGYNLNELARKYRYSTRHLRKILESKIQTAK